MVFPWAIRTQYTATAYFDGLAIYDDAETPSQINNSYFNWQNAGPYWIGAGTTPN